MFSAFDDLIEHENLETLLEDDIPILPLRGTVAFPFIILPLNIGVPRSTKLVKWAVREGSLIGLVTSSAPEVDEPAPDQLHRVGVVARIHRVMRSDKDSDTQQIVVQGLERIKIDSWTDTEPFLKAQVSLLPDGIGEDDHIEVEAYRRRIETLDAVAAELADYRPKLTAFLDD